MIEETGIITAINGAQICVETQIKSTCSGCQVNSHCGTGVVARALSPKKQQLVLDCYQQVQIGQQVKLGIPEQTLLAASALVYLLPVVTLLLTVILAQLWLETEGAVIVTALITSTLSFMAVRLLLQRQPEQYQPKLIAVIPQSISVTQIATS
ncbi:SoxR reducing system RseC family protein [Neptunicella sp. SCSIO 80796]|uniref:SoxR reducing system RseC family protein n=1 Tax=Neptunicella plasticusilytica TaxID=3117012 RepID=UPI003A4DFF40